MPPLNNARQDDIDDFDADYAYLDTIGESDSFTMWGWVIIYCAIFGIVAVIWELR